MTITVKELRLSLVWTKSFSKAEWMPYLADSHRYKSEFKLARQQKGDWLLPWQPGEWQHFWQYYLHTSEDGDLDKVDASTAWDYLVPLRAPTRAQVGHLPAAVKRVSLEGFCFPHSVGVIATLFLPFEKPLSLAEAVEQAVRARHYKMYGVTWQDDDKKSHGSLQGLANELIDRLHARVLGGTPRGLDLSEPITIATVIDANDVWSDAAAKEVAAIDRALYGLCVLKPGWKRGSMKDLVVHGREPLDPDLVPNANRLYTVKLGRAVWVPSHFSEMFGGYEDPTYRVRVRVLGCYHRNLSLATLQTRGLIHVARRAHEFLAEKSPISLLISNSTRNAVEILNKLHLGDMQTYRTWSAAYHIGFHLDMLKQVGAAVGVPWVEEDG